MAVIASISATARRSRKVRGKRWAVEMTRGKTGGAFGMNLFASAGLYDNNNTAEINAYHSARDPGELPYTLNPNLWCAELLPQLTGLAIHKDEGTYGNATPGFAWRSRYGRVAVTRRHIISCDHAHSWANGTWPIAPVSGTGKCRIRFIDNTGATVDRVQIHQASDAPRDLNMAVLDADLPESVHVMKVAPSNVLNELSEYNFLSLGQEFQPGSRPDGLGSHYARCSVGVSSTSPYSVVIYDAQEAGSAGLGITITHTVSGTGAGITVTVAGRTVTVTHGSAATNQTIANAVNTPGTPAYALVSASVFGTYVAAADKSDTKVTSGLLVPLSDYPLLNRQMFHAGISGFTYNVWKGDSGTPRMTVINGEVVLSGIISGGDSAQCSPATATWSQVLNALIVAADANAVSSGRMTAPTGYTVTPYTGEIL